MNVISSNHPLAWVFEASKKPKFEGGSEIPPAALAAEAENRWAGRCPPSFEEGTVCCRWWDKSADNPKGARVGKNGVMDFVTGQFLFWDHPLLFGKAWVAEFKAERIGSVIDNVWYDGVRYWRKNSAGLWMSDSSEVYRRSLIIGGLDSEKPRGGPSEADRAMGLIEDPDRRLQGAFPFLYEEKDTVVLSGSRYLNVSRIRPVQPAPGTRYWGEGFPWMAAWLEGMLRKDPAGKEQLPVFLAWFARAYQGALAHAPRQGHALFIVGPTDSGKTLVASKVVGEALGGYSEATDYIMGDDQFNGKAFESGVWTIDDAKIAADRTRHEEYSQVVKKVVANPSMVYRRMYCEGVTLPWLGRLIVTLNMNAVEMLPNIEAELLDKVCFFKASEHEISFAGCEAKITKELPHFLAHLRDYVIPETLKNPKSDRFGPAAYHHPELLAEAKGAAPSANFGEIVDQWRTHYFTFHDKKPEWSGTALELSQAMNEDGALTQILKQTVRSTYQFSRMLGQLATQGAEGIVKHKTSARWEYRILRPRPLAFPNP